MGNSVSAAVNVARLENGHLLNAAREQPAAALPLERDSGKQLEFGDVRDMTPDQGRTGNATAKPCRRLKKSGNLSRCRLRFNYGYSLHVPRPFVKNRLASGSLLMIAEN